MSRSVLISEAVTTAIGHWKDKNMIENGEKFINYIEILMLWYGIQFLAFVGIYILAKCGLLKFLM